MNNNTTYQSLEELGFEESRNKQSSQNLAGAH
jgi:hypothetical protein